MNADTGEKTGQFLKEKTSLSRVRGLLLGLAMGDTLGRDHGRLPAEGPLRAGVSTQLGCFTAEGTIRALVRGAHKGICHPPSVVWHAYCRWAALQGLEARRWGSGGEAWPDGWLAQVPVLAERRGSAPATVAALAQAEMGTAEEPTTSSRGCHALTRTLPVAVIGAAHGYEQAAQWAREIAALTHGDPQAHCRGGPRGGTRRSLPDRPERAAGAARGAAETSCGRPRRSRQGARRPRRGTPGGLRARGRRHATGEARAGTPPRPRLCSAACTSPPPSPSGASWPTHCASPPGHRTATRWPVWPVRCWARCTVQTPCRWTWSAAMNWPGSSTPWPETWSPSSPTHPAGASTARGGTRTGGTATPAGDPHPRSPGATRPRRPSPPRLRNTAQEAPCGSPGTRMGACARSPPVRHGHRARLTAEDLRGVPCDVLGGDRGAARLRAEQRPSSQVDHCVQSTGLLHVAVVFAALRLRCR